VGSPAIGFKSYWQFGREATWDTAATATTRLPFLTLGPEPNLGVTPSRLINSGVDNPENFVGIGQRNRLQGTTEFQYENFLRLIDCLMGTASFGSNGGTTTGPVSTIYTHAFKQRAIVNSLTNQMSIGDVPAGQVERLRGAKVMEMRLSGSRAFGGDEGIVSCEVSMLGRTYETAQAPAGTPAVPAYRPVLFQHLTTVLDGSGDAADLRALWSFDLTIRNALAENRLDVMPTGLEPVRNGWTEILLKLETEYQVKTLRDRYRALTEGGLSLTFDEPGATGRQVVLDIPKAHQVEPHSLGVPDMDVLRQTSVWRAKSDGGSPASGITITVKNTESAI